MLIEFRHQQLHLLGHDHRDHLEGRRIAHAGGEEKQHEHGEEAPESARLSLDAEEEEHAGHRDDHQQKGPEGDASAAELVGDPARACPTEGADQRPQEDVLQGVHLRELGLGQQREAGRVADEGSEGAGVEHTHDPVVAATEDNCLLFEGRLDRGDVVHAEPSRQSGENQEWNPNETSILYPNLVAVADALGFAADCPEHAGGDDQGHDELHDADPEIAKARVQGEGVPFLLLREEEGDVGHGGGEIAAAEPAQQGKNQEDRVGCLWVLHGESDAQCRQEQRCGCEGGPQAAAEDRHHE